MSDGDPAHDSGDEEGFSLADDICGRGGVNRQASALNIILVCLARKNGGSVTLTRDEFERAGEFGGEIEVDIQGEAVLKITLHEIVAPQGKPS